MKAPALALLLLLATSSLAVAGTYEDWYRVIGAARLGEYSPPFQKPEDFSGYKSALEGLLRERLKDPLASVTRERRSKWWGKAGEDRVSVWGEGFRVQSGEFWSDVHRFELKSPAEALSLALHVQHSTAAVVQVRGKRLLVTESFFKTDLSRDPNRAEAVLTAIWDAWEGSEGSGLRATILVSTEGGNAHFAGQIDVPRGESGLEAQAQAFLAKAKKHAGTKTFKQEVAGGTQYRYASWASLVRNAITIATRTAPSEGMSGRLRRTRD